MNTLTSFQSASSVSTAVDVATPQLVVRILQPGHAEKTLPLAFGKCTVGSSCRCQIQLTSSQVRPLHCLIVHKTSATTVTRWAAGALLNGHDFTTSTFRPGDCLQIGDVEVTLAIEEVVEKQIPLARPAKSAPVVASRSVSALEPRAFPAPGMSAENSLESDRLVRQLWSANYSARRRCRKLVHTLREVRAEAGSFDQQIDMLQEQLRQALVEREEISGELVRFQSASANREGQVAEELDRLISELNDAYEKSSEAETTSAEYVQKWTQLRGELETLHAEREHFDRSRADGELRTHDLLQAMEAREQDIAELASELAEAREAIELGKTREAQQSTHHEGLEAEVQQLQDERCQLVADRKESLQRQQELQQLLVERVNQVEQLQADLEQAKATAESVTLQSTEQATNSEQLRTELEDAKFQQKELQETIAEFQRFQPDWELAVAERDQRIGELLREREQVHGTILKLEERNAEQSVNCQGLQSALQQAEEDRGRLLDSQALYQESQTEWEQSLSKRDRRIEEIEVEYKAVCETLKTFEHGAFEQINACKRMEAQLASVCEDRDKIAADQSEHEQHRLRLEETLQNREQQIVELSEELAILGQSRGELQSELEGQKSTVRQLESELAKLRDRCVEITSNFDFSQQRHFELQQDLSERREELEQLHDQLDVARQRSESLESTLAERIDKSESLESEKAELKARCEQLSSDYSAKSEHCQDLESRLAQRQQSIMLFEADLKSVRSELQRSVDQTQQLEENFKTAESQLTVLQEELEAKDAHLVDTDEANSALQQERDELAQTLETTQGDIESTAEPEPPLAEESVGEEPLSDAEQVSAQEAEAAIARLQEMSVWSETNEVSASTVEGEVPEEETAQEDFVPASFIDQFDGDLEEDASLDNEPIRQSPLENHEPTLAGSEDESDDAALEAYMQNMMQRVRGESIAEDISAPLPKPADTPVEDPVTRVDTLVERVASSISIEEEPLSLESLKRSSHKPELPTDLAAMRELANSSARKAIATHSRGRHIEAALTKFLICLMSTGLAAYVLLTADDYSSERSLGGWVAGVVGVIWGFRVLRVLLEVVRAGSQPHQAAAEITVDNQPTPIDVAKAGCSDEG